MSVLAAAQRGDIRWKFGLTREFGVVGQDRDHPDTGGEGFGGFAADPVGRVVDPVPTGPRR